MSIESIYASLEELTVIVDSLEQELDRRDAERAQQAKAQAVQAKAPPAGKALPGLPGQNDLFGEWAAPNGRPANINTAAQLAKKLDNAIENVQWLLKSAEA